MIMPSVSFSSIDEYSWGDNKQMKFTKRAVRFRSVLQLLGLFAVTGVLLIGGTKSILDDGANAKVKKWKNVLDQRYLEIFVVTGNKDDPKAGCYNTQSLNRGQQTGDSAPQNLVDKLDVKAIAKENNAISAFVNGPRKWCLDWIDIPVGAERDFNGLKAAWVATLNMKGVTRGKENNYRSMTIARKSAFGINKGTKAFILDDPKGNTWVMKSYSLVLDPTLNRGKVPAMLGQLKLPEAWKYRVKQLDRDLVLIPESGIATIVQDDLDNTYDLTGPGYSNYKP
jgi:hypothetical protein